MAKSVNQVMLLGYLGNDPDVRWTAGGTGVAEMRLATTERVKKGGDWVDETEWHNLKAFNRLAEICRDYMHKGSKVWVQGRLHTSDWVDQQSGSKRYKTEIIVDQLILLGAREERSAAAGESARAPAAAPPQRQPQAPIGTWKPEAYSAAAQTPMAVADDPYAISDDDIPF